MTEDFAIIQCKKSSAMSANVNPNRSPMIFGPQSAKRVAIAENLHKIIEVILKDRRLYLVNLQSETQEKVFR